VTHRTSKVLDVLATNRMGNGNGSFRKVDTTSRFR